MGDAFIDDHSELGREDIFSVLIYGGLIVEKWNPQNHGKHCHRSSLWALRCVFLVYSLHSSFWHYPQVRLLSTYLFQGKPIVLTSDCIQF